MITCTHENTHTNIREQAQLQTYTRAHTYTHTHTHLTNHTHKNTKKRQDVAINFKNHNFVLVFIRDIFEVRLSFDADTIQG